MKALGERCRPSPIHGVRTFGETNNQGSTIAPFRITLQCRCGPVARPVMPERATT